MTPAHERLFFGLVLLGLALAHLFTCDASEPFFNNDETRHTMTGVFVRDAILDAGTSAKNPIGYAKRYYLQYPALGLLVWPPLFYGVEGVAMTLFGTSFETGRACIFAFAALGLLYTFRLIRLTHGPKWALAGTFLVGFAPLFFLYSQRVMLEVPAFAFVLGSIFHFEKYLMQNVRRDALFACLLAAFAALTRFDAVMLLPYFGLRLVFPLRLKLLLKKEVLLGVFLALCLTAPYYFFTMKEYGSTIDKSVQTGTGHGEPLLQTPSAWLFYFRWIPDQIGWSATVFAAFGVVLALWRNPRNWAPYLTLMVAAYITFTPIAEREYRHTIYWLPALAVFALVPVTALRQWLGLRVAVLALFVLFAGAVWEGTTQEALRYHRGYAEAAKFVVERSPSERPLMMDGELTGAFVYQVRRHDPERKFRVLRGDKLLYSVHTDAITAYKANVTAEEDVLKLLHEYDPQFIVIEDPQVLDPVPAGELLRSTLKNHPERFRVAHRVKIQSNHAIYSEAWLTIYEQTQSNPNRKKLEEMEVLGLGKKVSSN